MFVVVVVVVGGGDVGRTAANAATPQPTPQRRSQRRNVRRRTFSTNDQYSVLLTLNKITQNCRRNLERFLDAFAFWIWDFGRKKNRVLDFLEVHSE